MSNKPEMEDPEQPPFRILEKVDNGTNQKVMTGRHVFAESVVSLARQGHKYWRTTNETYLFGCRASKIYCKSSFWTEAVFLRRNPHKARNHCNIPSPRGCTCTQAQTFPQPMQTPQNTIHMHRTHRWNRRTPQPVVWHRPTLCVLQIHQYNGYPNVIAAPPRHLRRPSTIRKTRWT